MTYTEAVHFLYQLRQFGMKLGLEKTRLLAQAAGNPQDRLRFIHVAGTNGKGSTCAMIESIYRLSGRRTGLFTSPHLVSFGERIQIQGRPIAHDRVIAAVEKLQEWITRIDQPEPPTFFECVVVMALDYFAEQGCDVVVWETGLGGRLDATNIVQPLLSVITTIDFDHQEWLGSTLGAIAREKAGIIKPRVPVITGVSDTEPLEVIRQEALRKGAELTVLRSGEEGRVLGSMQLSLPGPHQRRNAALACLAVESLRAFLPVHPEVVAEGLRTARWPGRMHRIQRGEQRIWVDGAHNPSGVRALLEALRHESAGPSARALIFGSLVDKDSKEMLMLLAPAFSKIVLVPVDNPRGAAPSQLKAAATGGRHLVEAPSLGAALEQLVGEAEVVVCGSLYLAGEALQRLGELPAETGEIPETSLNDWRR